MSQKHATQGVGGHNPMPKQVKSPKPARVTCTPKDGKPMPRGGAKLNGGGSV